MLGSPNLDSATFRKLAAFFAVYVIWGSTYLAIRYGVETFPPVLLTTLRFVTAGALMLVVSALRREFKLSRDELRVAMLSGVVLIAANAIVCITEQKLASGFVAVVIGSMPIWILFASWIFFAGARPSAVKLAGSTLGVLGVAIIAFESQPTSVAGVGLAAVAPLFGSCALWTLGTLLQRPLRLQGNAFRFTGLQMLMGGVFAGVWSMARGELTGFDLAKVSTSSYAALAYLIVFGSLIAFSSYSYLSRTVESHLVSTYALVNPVIAVILGSLFYGEAVTATFVAGSLLILGGLAFILRGKRPAAA